MSGDRRYADNLGDSAINAGAGERDSANSIVEAPGQPTWGCNEFHLSLSRTVAIRAHQLEPLLQALRSSLRRWQRFATELGQMAVFVNDARTRTFLSLRTLPETDSQFKELVRRVDKAFMTQELAVFYE
eukprot:gene9398-11134_t